MRPPHGRSTRLALHGDVFFLDQPFEPLPRRRPVAAPIQDILDDFWLGVDRVGDELLPTVSNIVVQPMHHEGVEDGRNSSAP